MKIAIYARVSKDTADSSGRLQDPENQIVPLQKWADALGDPNPTIYVDRISGGNSNRPEFRAMLAKCRQRHHDLIIVWALDRFSREGIINTMSYIKQLRKYGVALRSYQESWCDTSQEGITDMILAVMSWAAAEERKKISDRTKAGLERARRQGKRLGRPPKKPPEKSPPEKSEVSL